MALSIAVGELGWKPAKGTINLITGAGFEWGYKWQGGPFPSGAELYLLVGPDRWDFVIDQEQASVTKDASVTDAVAARTPFRLMIKLSGHPPICLIKGRVKRWEER